MFFELLGLPGPEDERAAVLAAFDEAYQRLSKYSDAIRPAQPALAAQFTVIVRRDRAKIAEAQQVPRSTDADDHDPSA